MSIFDPHKSEFHFMHNMFILYWNDIEKRQFIK